MISRKNLKNRKILDETQINEIRVKNKELLLELKKRVTKTYFIRINASKRLRKKDEEYKKLNMFYTGMVTILAILSIEMDKSIYGISISSISLISSIILTYFMFYTSEKNLQERAYRMEETYKKLDKLRNKISLKIENDIELEEQGCKKLFNEYENIIEGIENHEEIDYYRYRVEYKENAADNLTENKKQVSYNEIKRKVKKIIKYVLPTIFFIGVMLLAE